MSDTRELRKQFKNSTPKKKSTQAILYHSVGISRKYKDKVAGRNYPKKKERKKEKIF